MTVYALRLQNATDTAARARMADLLGLTPSGNVSARSGIRPGPTAGVVAVTAGTMNVTVEPFMAFIDGGVSDAQGGYPFVSDAVETRTLANGHASLSRTDVVAAVVRDNSFDGSGSLTATVEVVQGSPGGGVPTLPLNALPLRNIVVPAGASTGTGGLTSGALSTDRRTYVAGLGGVVPVATQAERDALPNIVPTLVYRRDTDQIEVRRTAGWQVLQNTGAWTAYTPALFNDHVAGPGPFAGRYRMLDDKTMALQISYTISSGASLPAQLIFGLPSGMTASVASSRTQSLMLRWYNGASGQFVGFASASSGYASGTQLGCVKDGGAVLGAADMAVGANLDINGTIELA